MNTTRRTIGALAIGLALTLTGCNLGPEEGEVTEVEQELDSTELTVNCNGGEIDIDIPKTEEWEVGEVYGCTRRPEDRPAN